MDPPVALGWWWGMWQLLSASNLAAGSLGCPRLSCLVDVEGELEPAGLPQRPLGEQREVCPSQQRNSVSPLHIPTYT